MPRQAGDYELLSEIARGGMGVIYKARQISLNREVALKMVSPGGHANEAAKERFRVEAEAVAALDHSNIIPIYEVGEFQGQPFYSMKLVSDGSLADLLRGHDPEQGVEPFVKLLEKVCRAVQHAHERGVIHRDIKPSNILLEKRDQPMLADFGLAKRSGRDATLTGVILGTPHYMAPEQAAGQAKSATTRTDVYSLGVILYEILTGRPPYAGDDPLAVVVQVAEAKPVPPSSVIPTTDKGLEAICLKCLAKSPEERYASAGALADDLARWLAGEPISIRPLSTGRQLLEWLRKHSSAAIRVIGIGVVSGLLMSISVMMIVIPQVMTSSEKSLEYFPSLSKPILLRLNWTLITEISHFLGIPLIFTTLLAWLMQGPLVLMLLRPRDSGSATLFGLGCGTISGITANFCGLSQAVLLAMVVVPHIVVLREVSISALGTPDEQITFQKRVMQSIPDLQAIPEKDRGVQFLPYLVSLQVQGIFEAVFVSAFLALLLGTASAICQTLVVYYLKKRETSIVATMMYYTESVIALTFLASLPLSSWGITFTMIYYFWGVILAGVALLGAIHRWGIILRTSLYILCILVSELISISDDQDKRWSGYAYLLLMIYLGFLILSKWRQDRKSRMSVNKNSKPVTPS